MKSITINMGDAFLVKTPPNGDHLYIAIAPTTNDRFLFVNVTTLRNKSEKTCLIQPGDDAPRFIKETSAIAYRYAREFSADELTKEIMPNSRIPKGFVSQAVFKRIQIGGLKSKLLRQKYKRILVTLLEPEE